MLSGIIKGLVAFWLIAFTLLAAFVLFLAIAPNL